MLTNFLREELGFTLIELMIVIAVLGVLAGIAVPQIGGILGRADQADVENDLNLIADGLDMYRIESENRAYPSDDSELTASELDGVSEDTLKDPAGNKYEYNYNESNGEYLLYTDALSDSLGDNETYIYLDGNSDGKRETGTAGSGDISSDTYEIN